MNQERPDITAKKMLIITSIVGLAIIASNPAHASFSEIVDGWRAYVGLGVSYNSHGAHSDFKKTIENNYKGSIKNGSANLLIPVLGVKFKDNFSLEFGYNFYNKLKISGDNPGYIKLRNVFLDIIGDMPIGSSNFDLLGGIGIGRMRMSPFGTSVTAAMKDAYNKFGLRIKFGSQYNINNNLAARCLIGHQQVGRKNNNQALRNTQFASLDVLYLV